MSNIWGKIERDISIDKRAHQIADEQPDLELARLAVVFSDVAMTFYDLTETLRAFRWAIDDALQDSDEVREDT